MASVAASIKTSNMPSAVSQPLLEREHLRRDTLALLWVTVQSLTLGSSMTDPLVVGRHCYQRSLFRPVSYSKRTNPQAVTRVAARLSGQALLSRIRSRVLLKLAFKDNNRRRRKLPRQQFLLLKLRRRELPRRPRRVTSVLLNLS